MNNKKYKIVLKICAFTIMCIYNPAFAQVRNGDSVIPKGSIPVISGNTSSSGKVTKNAATPQGRVEYGYTPCPSGYTGASGGSTFKTQQRMISSFTYNGATRTATGPWEAVTNDYCTRRESRTRTCPTGQTGTREQERTLRYDNVSGYTTGSWRTTYDSCVTPPPPPPPVYNPPPPVYNPPTPTYPPPVYNPPTPVNPPPVTVTPNPPVYNPPAPTVVCWPDSWPNSSPCPAGQTGAITSTTYRECRNGPYSPGFEYQANHNNTCTSPPPVIPPPPTGCPWAGQTARTFCDFDTSGGSQGGADCIEGTWIWGVEIYLNDASCNTRIEIHGSDGGGQGHNCRYYGSCARGY